MNSKRCNLAVTSLLLALFAHVSLFARPANQAVTFSNFNFVNSVAASLTHVYFATTNGITRYDKTERKWELPLTGGEGLNWEEPRLVWIDRFDQHLYVQTTSGIYEYDLLLDSWFPLTELPQIDKAYRAIAAPDNLFPPTGFSYFGRGQFSDDRGRNFFANQIIDDNSGTLWYGTRGYGAATSDASGGAVSLLPTGLIQPRVDWIVRDDSLLWLGGLARGTGQMGITGFNPETYISHFLESDKEPSFPSLDMVAAAADTARLYLGTEEGIIVIDKASWRVERRLDIRHGLRDKQIYSLAIFGDSLFAGTADGLTLFTSSLDSARQVYVNQFGHQPVYDLVRDENWLWIGAGNGAFRLSLADNQLQNFVDSGVALFGGVIDIVPTTEFVWLAGRRGLLRIGREDGKAVPVDGLSARIEIRSISAIDSIAAVATDEGVYVLLPKKNGFEAREIKTYEGLPSDNALAVLFDSDYLWIGTDLGLTRFWWHNPGFIH